MRIQNNITAQNSHRQYGINNINIGKNVEKLSSGYRVNRAADDAAGLAISEKMRTQIRGLNMASRNSQDGISLVQTAEGAMQAAHDIMQRMRELAVQASNGTNDDPVDRAALNLEFEQLNAELIQIESTVKFNDMEIFGKPFTLQSGANEGDLTRFNVPNLNAAFGFATPEDIDRNLERMSMNFALKEASQQVFADDAAKQIFITDTAADERARLEAEWIDNGWITAATDPSLDFPANVASFEDAQRSLIIMTDAINELSTSRAELGAIQNRLEYKIANLDNSAENLAAAESRIRDVDMAKMMTEFTKNNILFQASTAMLAQANALPQGVLQLLG